MLIKKLSTQGNSSSLIIDRSLMKLLDIHGGDDVKISVEGRKLIVEPLTEEERQDMLKKAIQATGKKYKKTFERLA